MRAAFVTGLGPAEAIQVGELPVPTLGPTDVLVWVEVVVVNPVDTFVRSGAYPTPTPFPFVVGRDLVGTVAVASPGAAGFAKGGSGLVQQPRPRRAAGARGAVHMAEPHLRADLQATYVGWAVGGLIVGSIVWLTDTDEDWWGLVETAACDNALAEAVNGLYKAELTGRQDPWRGAEQVELATLAWVQWWNQRRLHGALDNIPPAEHEAIYYREHPQSKEVV